MSDSMRLLYLTKRFPRLSETFILEEIIGLEENGIDLKLFSIGDPKEPVIQNKVKDVQGHVWYLHNNPSSYFLDGIVQETRALICIGIKDPKRLLRAFETMISKKVSLRSLKHLLEGAVVAKKAKQLKVEGLHAAFAHSPAAVISYASELSGIPFSFAAHAKDLFTTDKDALYNRAHSARFVLCCSQGAFDEMVQIAPGANVIYMPHGVNVEEFSPSKDKLDIHDELRLLCVGRLVEKKGIRFLIEAAAMLKKDGINFHLRICGSGDLKTSLSELVSCLDLKDEVEFFGAVTHEEVAKQLGWSDIYVQPSIQLGNGDKDGIPNALLEAMAAGKAVVATSIAGIPEVITSGVNGVLVKPQDAVGLFTAMKPLFQNIQLRGRLGDGAVEQVRNNWDRQKAHRQLKELFLQTYSLDVNEDYLKSIDIKLPEKNDRGTVVVQGSEVK